MRTMTTLELIHESIANGSPVSVASCIAAAENGRLWVDPTGFVIASDGGVEAERVAIVDRPSDNPRGLDDARRLARRIGVAFGLAASHGHLWACDAVGALIKVWMRHGAPADWHTVIQDIGITVEESTKPDAPGVVAPTLDDAGRIVHMDERGAVVWAVSTTGEMVGA